MSFQSSAFRTSVRLFLLAAAPVLMAACTADFGPSPMPMGYKYDSSQAYRVPSAGPVQAMQYPGESAAVAPTAALQPSAGEAATPMASTMPMIANAPVQADAGPVPPMVGGTPVEPSSGPQWLAAAGDLLSKTEHDFGRLQEPVYVRDAMPGMTGEAAFRQALSDVLAIRHYKVSTDKEKAPFGFDYGVGEIVSGKTPLSLTTLAQGKKIITEKGEYDLSPGAPVVTSSTDKPSSMPPADAPVAKTAEKPAPATTAMPRMGASTTDTGPRPEPSAALPPPMDAPTAKAEAKTDAGSTDAAPKAAMMPPSTPPATSTSQAATPDSATPPAPTYVYDGRSSGKPSGKTAYEELQGTGHEVGMAPPADSGMPN